MADSQNDDILELRILTAVFYSRFIQYFDSLDAMTAELNEHKTIWVNKPELLPGVFVKMSVAPQSMSISDFVFAGLLRHIRRRQPKIPLVSTLADPPRTPNFSIEVKHVCIPSMDAYMILYEDGELKRQYLWATIQQLVADCYFMGRVDFLNQVTNIVRVGIAWTCASSLTQITRRTHK